MLFGLDANRNNSHSARVGQCLFNLYNERPAWLDLTHRNLDEAVFAAYGWDPNMTDDHPLAALLELNLECTQGEK